MCDSDPYEPDGELVRATEIAANAQPVQHNFCPGGDVDWARVAISAPGVYEFFIDAQGPDADPLLTLFDRDEKTALFTNDDFGPGLSARILWRFTQAGV